MRSRFPPAAATSPSCATAARKRDWRRSSACSSPWRARLWPNRVRRFALCREVSSDFQREVWTLDARSTCAESAIDATPLHAGQGGDPLWRSGAELCGAGAAHRRDRAGAEIAAWRGARRSGRHPRRQPSRLSGPALCLRPARRDAGADQLAPRGAGAALHPARCRCESAGGGAGLCADHRTARGGDAGRARRRSR